MRLSFVLLWALLALTFVCSECRSVSKVSVGLTTELLDAAWTAEPAAELVKRKLDNPLLGDVCSETPIEPDKLSLYICREKSNPSYVGIYIDKPKHGFYTPGVHQPMRVSVNSDEHVFTVRYINSSHGLELRQLFSYVMTLFNWIQGKFDPKKEWTLAMDDVAHDEVASRGSGEVNVLLSPIFIFREGRSFYESKLARLLSSDVHHTMTLTRSPPLPDGPELCADDPDDATKGSDSNNHNPQEDESDLLSSLSSASSVVTSARTWRSCTNNDAMLWGKRTIAELTRMEVGSSGQPEIVLEAGTGPWDVEGMEEFAAIERTARAQFLVKSLDKIALPKDATVAGLLTKEFARDHPKEYLAIYMYIRYWLKVRRLWCFENLDVDSEVLEADAVSFEGIKEGGGEEFMERVGFDGGECSDEEEDNSFEIIFRKKSK